MFTITEIQDVSRPICKRYVAHVEVETANKRKVKRVISEATEAVKEEKETVHVVWLYVHYKKDLICRTMWVDSTFDDAPLPKPLDFNDFKEDIGIVWM